MNLNNVYPAKLRKAIRDYGVKTHTRDYEIIMVILSWALLKTTFGYVIIHACTNKTNSFRSLINHMHTCGRCLAPAPKDIQVVFELSKE